MGCSAKTLRPVCFWLSYVVLLLVPRAWKNVGITMTCHWCDVKNIK